MLGQLALLAVLTEAVTELTKDVAEKGFSLGQVVALVFGQLIAWGTSLDLLEMVGVAGAPWLTYVGIALTGLVVSRGAGYVHALWDRVAEAGGGGRV